MTARNDGAAVAGWLGLAAAPLFAGMALATGLIARGAPDILCAAGRGASPLSGMPFMYLLMSIVHIGPWLRLLASRRHDGRGASRAIDPDHHQHKGATR